ncbi:hypothetical protein M5K25_019471 [Dendrobium thyrsiflorum]|uniref:Uncharacterized protein n=1 Tax=Dendrobium thyrsiflorum TaxID=117978 RepID=A0ABD0ULQ1_DENTH
MLAIEKFHHLPLKTDGGGMNDGPDQDHMVPSSQAIVIPGLLSQRRLFSLLFSVNSKSDKNN